MGIPRINYKRATLLITKVTKALPISSQKLKSTFLFILFVILSYQVITLSQGPQSHESKDKLVVIEKDASVSNHYRHLLKKYSPKFLNLPTDEKCNTYFNELYDIDHDWDLTTDVNNGYDKGTFDHSGFIKDRINDYKTKNENKEPSDAEKAAIEIQYQKALAKTESITQIMIDSVTHLRVYGKCFLQQSTTASKLYNDWFGNENPNLDGLSHESINKCHNIEQRLFPFLSRELPFFVRWDGQKVYGIPKMSKYVPDDGYDDTDIPLQNPLNNFENFETRDEEKKSEGKITDDVIEDTLKLFKRMTGESDCFLNDWRKSLNGKGLVLSVATRYESDIIGLIRVLRALNNKLPIQLVHKGDLSEESQKNIVKAAREEDVKVPLHLYEKVRNHVPHNFPKQEVWFVNVKRCIRKEYEGKFNGFANKLLAYLFNSFDDMILMDTDAVPLVKPMELFKSGPYRRTDTIFYHDRFTSATVAQHDADYFMSLMPSSADEAFFDIPKVGNVTLENRYLKSKHKHVMEAGMVAIKKSTHFTGILMSLQLNFWGAASSRIWGDKELFWLGQSISGNENYEFNKHDAVSVGELTPMTDRPRNTIAHELCSTHPGHLSGDDDTTLVWINSGMKNCKVKGTQEKDFTHDKIKHKNFKNIEELGKWFEEPLRIKAALVPPGGDRRVVNPLDEPSGPWQMNSPCKNYLWCAYDILGASSDPKDRGGYIEYDDLTVLTNEYIGKLWLEQDLVYLKEYNDAKLSDKIKIGGA